MKRFEYLEVSGTHEDLGRAIGTKFKDAIQLRIKHAQERIIDYEGYLKKTEPFFLAAKDAFPDLTRELTATAHAAGVGVADYFAINNHEVRAKHKKEYIMSDHCTVAVSFGEHGAVVGHNEDWEGATADSLYVLKATIGETTFTGLQYKVAVPGIAATMNNWGLVQCINSLNQISQIGVPKNILARAVLECRTLDEAESLIRKTKRASGYNHVLVQGQEVRNIEIAGDKIAIEKVIGKPYVHTNHYLSSELKSLEKFHTKSSEARYARAEEIVKNGMAITEMEALLSDKTNPDLPISRDGATLGSFIALPAERKVYPPSRNTERVSWRTRAKGFSLRRDSAPYEALGEDTSAIWPWELHICYGPPNAGEYIEYK